MLSRHTNFKSLPSVPPWIGDVQELKCIGNGVSSLVFAIDSRHVVKIPLGSSQSKRDIEIERGIYREFKRIKEESHDPNGKYVLRCLDVWNPKGLVFERCEESVRSRLRRKGEIGLPETLKWIEQASRGLDFVHSCGVVQGDVGCHNMLLDSKGNLKLADFAGSSINTSDASIDYEVHSRLPGLEQPTQRSDVFALGSAFYEMSAGSKPYANVDSHRDIQTLYRQKKFPDVSGMPLVGPIILRCWKQEYESALEIAHALEQYNREAKIDEVEADISLDGLMLTESEPSLDNDSSRSSGDHFKSDTYVGKPSRRDKSHKRARDSHYVSGRREKRKPYLQFMDQTSLIKFIFPGMYHHTRAASRRNQHYR